MADLKDNKATAKTTSAELSPATSYRGSASEDKGAKLGTTEAQTPSGLDAVEDTAIIEEEAHDDPEIAQLPLIVRQTVSLEDDPTLPTITFRYFVLCILFIVPGAFLSQMSHFRTTQAPYSVFFVQIACHYVGRGLAKVLPAWQVNLPFGYGFVKTDTFGLELDTVAKGPYVLNGDNGYQKKHDLLPVASYNFSAPFLSLSGVLNLRSEERRVGKD